MYNIICNKLSRSSWAAWSLWTKTSNLELLCWYLASMVYVVVELLVASLLIFSLMSIFLFCGSDGISDTHPKLTIYDLLMHNWMISATLPLTFAFALIVLMQTTCNHNGGPTDTGRQNRRYHLGMCLKPCSRFCSCDKTLVLVLITYIYDNSLWNDLWLATNFTCSILCLALYTCDWG